MLFNFGKCKCIRINGNGHIDKKEYKMSDAVLVITTKEKDLRVKFSVDMKASEQCEIVAHCTMHKATVRPHLEYSIQAWRLYRKKDIEKLERIQPKSNQND